ncbi:uncharacterized protein [Narcine bancroftii]|uniref:uncharacterized protein isoform X20 n=1 Tax=Narcine bancroftii TaxID=1343680 RepID=UPI003831ACC8
MSAAAAGETGSAIRATFFFWGLLCVLGRSGGRNSLEHCCGYEKLCTQKIFCRARSPAVSLASFSCHKKFPEQTCVAVPY